MEELSDTDEFSEGNEADCSSSDIHKLNCSLNEKFVELLLDFPVLLSRSCAPKVFEAKEKAVLDLQKLLFEQLGKDLTVKQIRKKINNLKEATKRKKWLKDWESKLMYAVEVSNTAKPSPREIALTVEREEEVATASNVCADHELSAAEDSATPRPKRQRLNNIEGMLPETDATLQLSNTQLQRLLLLKQLELTRLQICKEKLLIEKINARSSKSENIITNEQLELTRLQIEKEKLLISKLDADSLKRKLNSLL